MFFRVNFKFRYRRRVRSFGIPVKVKTSNLDTVDACGRVWSFGILIKVKTSRIELFYGANDHFKNSIDSS